MAAVNSTMLELGTKTPQFELQNVDGKSLTTNDVRGENGLLVVFWCNHCPYVKHIRNQFITLAADWQKRGVGVVAIMSNDVENYPDDSPENMKIEHETHDYGIPYLYDADQTVALAFKAACTPDFYLFDENLELAYRGQFDAARPGGLSPVTGAGLASAIDAMLDKKDISPEQTPSIGCNIKWKSANTPKYFTVKS